MYTKDEALFIFQVAVTLQAAQHIRIAAIGHKITAIGIYKYFSSTLKPLLDLCSIGL